MNSDTMREKFEAKFELWFFRDLNDESRRRLIALLYGEAAAEEATTHAIQRHCLRHHILGSFEAGRQLGMEQAKKKPLTEAEVWRLVDDLPDSHGFNECTGTEFRKFVRAVEAAHGITTPPAGDSDTQS